MLKPVGGKASVGQHGVVCRAVGWLFALCFVLLATTGRASATPDPLWFAGNDENAKVRLHFFHSNGCPHCRAAMPVLRDMAKARPWLQVEYLEVDDPANEQSFTELAHLFGAEPEAVPAFFVCRDMVIGFDSRETTGEWLAGLAEKCRDEVSGKANGATAEAAEAPPVDLPFFGRVDADRLSLPVLTLVLGGLDAFNPCAFFVLLFLLSFLVRAKSRARMALVGGLFVTVSGVMYFLFMAAWLNLFLLLHNIGWVTLAAGLVAIFIGLMGVKDYFFFGKGPSLSIPEGAKPTLYRRMGEISGETQLPVLIGGTVLLAVTANMYELLCTSGFPLVYTSVLARHEPGELARYAWLAAYNVVYVLPLLAIVAVFVVSFGARKLSEREGRLLKLVSGLMMLELGLMLVLAPDLLSNVLAAVMLLVVAVAAAVLIDRLDHRSGAKAG